MTFEGSLRLNSNRSAHEKTACFDEMLKKFFEDALGINIDKKSAREELLRENKVIRNYLKTNWSLKTNIF